MKTEFCDPSSINDKNNNPSPLKSFLKVSKPGNSPSIVNLCSFNCILRGVNCTVVDIDIDIDIDIDFNIDFDFEY